MKFGPAKHFIALLLAAPLLAGCLERGQPTMVDTSADDDAFCRANNVAVGSNDYVNCRKNRDVQRGNANARADRAQRNLAEQMLNNPAGRDQEAIMNEDVFNASLRRFLKKVGITSQREIEKAVRDAIEAGKLKGHEKLPAKMVLTIGGVSLSHEIDDEIELG